MAFRPTQLLVLLALPFVLGACCSGQRTEDTTLKLLRQRIEELIEDSQTYSQRTGPKGELSDVDTRELASLSTRSGTLLDEITTYSPAKQQYGHLTPSLTMLSDNRFSLAELLQDPGPIRRHRAGEFKQIVEDLQAALTQM